MTLKKKFTLIGVFVLIIAILCCTFVACDDAEAPSGTDGSIPSPGDTVKDPDDSVSDSTPDSGTPSDPSGGEEDSGNVEPEPVDYSVYTLSNGGTTITGLTEYGRTFTELDIPSQIDDVVVTGIAENAFKGCNQLTSITVPDSVTSIGKSAFEGCTALTDLTIPFIGASMSASDGYNQVLGYLFGYLTQSYQEYYDSFFSSDDRFVGMTLQYEDTYNEDEYRYYYYIPSSLTTLTVTGGEMYSSALKGCEYLKTVTIGDGVTSLCGFSGCTALESVTIGNGVTDIPYGTFSYLDNLLNVSLGDNITSIGNRAFYGCERLRYIELPDSLVSINGCAFQNCYSLVNIVIGDNVREIKYNAFDNCMALTSVTLGSGLESIENYAFQQCYKLVEVINRSSLDITGNPYGYVASYALNVKSYGDSDICNVNDYLFYTYNNTNYLLGYVGDDDDITLPDNYNGQSYEMYKYAFYHSRLTKITVPGNVNISDEAFAYSSYLTEVYVSDGVTSIGANVFSDCNSLTSLRLPDSLTELNSSFRSDIMNYNVSGGVKYLGNENNPYLVAVTVSDQTSTSFALESGVKFIGNNAFYGCTAITSIIIPDTVVSIGQYAFYGCTALTNITIGRGVSYIGFEAFVECSALKTAVFKNTSNWTCGNNLSMKSQDVTDSSNNAKVLTYRGNQWIRK